MSALKANLQKYIVNYSLKEITANNLFKKFKYLCRLIQEKFGIFFVHLDKIIFVSDKIILIFNR